MPPKANFRATQIVHWPTGPVACCARHARGLINLGKLLGSHVVSTTLTEPADCMNCINEAKKIDAP